MGSRCFRVSGIRESMVRGCVLGFAVVVATALATAGAVAAPASPVALTTPPTWSASPTPTITGEVPPGGDAPPVTEARFVVCDAAGTSCGATQSVPVSGPAFSLSPTVGQGMHVVRVWLADVTGSADPASAGSVVVGFDDGAPSPPVDLAAHGIGETGTSVTWSLPAVAGAPVDAAFVSWCEQGGTCSPAEQAAHLLAAPLGALTPGQWTVRVWLRDQAGNVDPAQAATAPVTVSAPSAATTPAPPAVASHAPGTVTGPAATTTPTVAAPHPTVRARAGVTVRTRIRSGRKVIVLLAANAPGPLRVRVASRSRTGRSLGTTTRTVRLRRGVATLAYTAPRGTRGVTVRVSYAGAAAWLPGSAKTTRTLPAR